MSITTPFFAAYSCPAKSHNAITANNIGRRKNYVLCRRNYIRHRKNYIRPFFATCKPLKDRLLQKQLQDRQFLGFQQVAFSPPKPRQRAVPVFFPDCRQQGFLMRSLRFESFFCLSLSYAHFYFVKVAIYYYFRNVLVWTT